MGAEAGFDFEESDGFVKYLWGEVGDLHDLLAGASAGSDSLEDFGLDVGVAEEALLSEFSMLFGIIFGEELAKDVARLGIGESTLSDELVAPLRIGVSNVARDGVNVLTLV